MKQSAHYHDGVIFDDFLAKRPAGAVDSASSSAIDRTGHRAALVNQGADAVVTDLAEVAVRD